MDEEKILTAITELKTENRILWNKHDESAQEFRVEVRHRIEALENRMGEVKCPVHTNMLENMDKRLGTLERILYITLGLGGVIGVFALIWKKLTGE